MSGHFPMNVRQHYAGSQRPQGSTQCLQAAVAEDGAMDVDVARLNLARPRQCMPTTLTKSASSVNCAAYVAMSWLFQLSLRAFTMLKI